MIILQLLKEEGISEQPEFKDEAQMIEHPVYNIMHSFRSDLDEEIVVLMNVMTEDIKVLPGAYSDDVEDKINEVKAQYFPEVDFTPKAVARPLEGVNLTEYARYREFFDKELKGSRKDKFDGRIKLKDSFGFWQPAVNDLEALKGSARIAGLKMGMIKPYFSLYQKEMPSELLCQMEPWKGEDVIAKLALHVVCSNLTGPEVVDVFKHWLAHSIKRMETGDQNVMIILQGAQGIGKDTWIEALCSGFSPYFNHFSDDAQEKDVLSKLCKNIIVNISEVDKLNRRDPGFIKDIITRRSAQFRKAYAQDDAEYRVVASLIGSTNTMDFLTDHTGNRRFWVLKVQEIDHGYAKNLGAQILAQAMRLAETGYHAKRSTIEKLEATANEITPVDPDELFAEMWNARLEKMVSQTKVFSLSDVEDHLIDLSRAFKVGINTVKNRLKRMGGYERVNGTRYKAIDMGQFKKRTDDLYIN